jgi:hypothetical protein
MSSGLITAARGKRLILLFYDGFEMQARPGRFGRSISEARRVLRQTKRTMCRQQVRTGFYTAFLALRDSLRAAGCEVRVNDFATARRYPHYPIGVAGYPGIIGKLARAKLVNPRMFGPGDFGDPMASIAVAEDPKFVTLIQPSGWFADLYKPFCGAKIWTWFAGIDTKKWLDLSRRRKEVDFIVYDKIRWHREERVPRILERILRHLAVAGHSYVVLRYGHHHHSAFARALARSRAMLFVCEHETQGLAYQEALACNLPVLAWDEGELVDPMLKPYLAPGSAVSAVPYFDETCGMTFKIDGFEAACEEFWARRDTYRPRAYVENTLSLPLSGARYLAEYERIAGI